MQKRRICTSLRANGKPSRAAGRTRKITSERIHTSHCEAYFRTSFVQTGKPSGHGDSKVRVRFSREVVGRNCPNSGAPVSYDGAGLPHAQEVPGDRANRDKVRRWTEKKRNFCGSSQNYRTNRSRRSVRHCASQLAKTLGIPRRGIGRILHDRRIFSNENIYRLASSQRLKRSRLPV